MNYKRFGRVCICLLLVCVLFLNCSPIRAYAIDPVTFAGVSVAGSIVAASIIQGVGVLPVDSEDGAFGSLVNNCVSFLESTSNFVADGAIRVTGVLNATGGRTAFVPLALVQSVWEWLFQPSSGAALSGSTFNSYYTSDPCTSYSQALSYAAHCPAAYEGNLYTNGRYVRAVIVTSVSQYVSLSDGTLSINGYGTNHSIWYEGLSSWMTRSLSLTYTYTSASKLSTSPLVSSSNDGLKLGEIQSPTYGVDMPILLENAPVYAPWASAITKIPSYSNSDEEVDGIPVTIPDSFESALGQTQAGAQAGTNDLSWADSVPDTDTLTLADIVSAIKAIPQEIGKVISEALVKAFAISDTFIATKVEALTAKYPYLDTFLALGADLKSFFLSLGTKPPVIYIDLGAATGSYSWGGSMAFLDLTWYSQYKSAMDNVLGAFIWLWLAWRVFLCLPGLINGASGAAGSVIRYGERSTKSNDGGADK